MDEKQSILDLIKREGSASAAAKAAGISLRSFLRRMREYNIPVGRRGRPRVEVARKSQLNALSDKVAVEHAHLRRVLPDIDSADLHLILCCIMRPIEQRRFLLRHQEGRYVR